MLWAEHVARNTAGQREDVFAEVRREFTDAELVELTGICGLFAVSNRFQDSMRLPIEEQGEVDKIRQSVRADPVRLKAYVARLVEHWPHADPSISIALPPLPTQCAGENGVGGEFLRAGRSQPNLPPQAEEVVSRRCRVHLPDLASATGDTARFFAAAGRLLGGLPNFVRLWGHVPHVGKLVLPFFVAIERARCGGVLPAALKLLVIARTSHINAAAYTLAHTLAIAQAEGVPAERLDELATVSCVVSPEFSGRERAALVWTQHVAQNTAKHHDTVFEELKRHFNDAEIVELTGLCAETNMVNRICSALRVPVEPADSLAAWYRNPRMDPAGLRSYLESVLADWPQVLPVPDALAA